VPGPQEAEVRRPMVQEGQGMEAPVWRSFRLNTTVAWPLPHQGALRHLGGGRLAAHPEARDRDSGRIGPGGHHARRG
jgi:hypothetical protein